MEQVHNREILAQAISQRIDGRDDYQVEKRMMEGYGKFNPEALLFVLGLDEAFKNTIES